MSSTTLVFLASSSVLFLLIGVLLYLGYGRYSYRSEEPDQSSRRGFLGLIGGGAVSALGTAIASRIQSDAPSTKTGPSYPSTSGRSPVQKDRTNMMVAPGEVENDFDPMEMLVDWDYGNVKEENGQTVREYTWDAIDKEIEIAPGIKFPAWTYEGRVPGPTIRCKEGDLIRIHFRNNGSHPHTIHFHGIHPFEMDGVPGAGPGEIPPGAEFTYEFEAEPFGCHLYHCHAIPLKRHIHKGLYGAFIVDPKEGRPPARELMMMMNGFDTNFDGDNEIYAVNTVAHAFMKRHIPAKVGETIRIYLINALEFDFVNSFHSHAQFFDYYDHGTSLEPDREMVDTIKQTQAQRGIIELSYDTPGNFMFHAHQSEFAELGWMGKFNVVEPDQFEDALNEAGVSEQWDKRATEGSTV